MRKNSTVDLQSNILIGVEYENLNDGDERSEKKFYYDMKEAKRSEITSIKRLSEF